MLKNEKEVEGCGDSKPGISHRNRIKIKLKPDNKHVIQDRGSVSDTTHVIQNGRINKAGRLYTTGTFFI